MELGEKLRIARQEAGLSQRQLCGDIITRNMLSLIEHGTARPSMDTLRSLAVRLGKPVGYFLEEEAALSPNQQLMERVRHKTSADSWILLKEFQHPDPVLEWEWKCRSYLAGLAAAEQALEESRFLYARQILEETAKYDVGIPELERKRLLLLGRVPGMNPVDIAPNLPSIDEELMLRAEAALAQGNAERAFALLSAMENLENPDRNLLQGKALLLQKQYCEAAEHLKKAEGAYPNQCWPLLEECFRETGDFKSAYIYACRQR